MSCNKLGVAGNNQTSIYRKEIGSSGWHVTYQNLTDSVFKCQLVIFFALKVQNLCGDGLCVDTVTVQSPVVSYMVRVSFQEMSVSLWKYPKSDSNKRGSGYMVSLCVNYRYILYVYIIQQIFTVMQYFCAWLIVCIILCPSGFFWLLPTKAFGVLFKIAAWILRTWECNLFTSIPQHQMFVTVSWLDNNWECFMANLVFCLQPQTEKMDLTEQTV